MSMTKLCVRKKTLTQELRIRKRLLNLNKTPAFAGVLYFLEVAMFYNSFHQSYVWAGNVHPVLLLITLALIFFITFIPSFIAFSNQHTNRVAILILNIIFGW